MKKVFVTIAIVILGICTTSASENLTIDPKIISKFEKDFSFATSAKWQLKEDLVQVSFLLNEQAVTAWYNSDAELVIIARNILYSHLPISITRSLEKRYAGANFFSIIEITHNNQLHYQITAETKKKTLLLKATPDGTIEIKKRIK